MALDARICVWSVSESDGRPRIAVLRASRLLCEQCLQWFSRKLVDAGLSAEGQEQARQLVVVVVVVRRRRRHHRPLPWHIVLHCRRHCHRRRKHRSAPHRQCRRRQSGCALTLTHGDVDGRSQSSCTLAAPRLLLARFNCSLRRLRRIFDSTVRAKVFNGRQTHAPIAIFTLCIVQTCGQKVTE